MPTMAKLSAASVFALAAIGATVPPQTATVTVQKGYDKGSGLGTGTAQVYHFAKLDACEGRKGIARFSWITGAEKSKPLPSGMVIYLTAYTDRFTPGGASGLTGFKLNAARCENRSSFTPQAGETYIVLQKVEIGKACSMSVLAKSTNAAPPYLAELPQLQC